MQRGNRGEWGKLAYKGKEGKRVSWEGRGGFSFPRCEFTRPSLHFPHVCRRDYFQILWIYDPCMKQGKATVIYKSQITFLLSPPLSSFKIKNCKTPSFQPRWAPLLFSKICFAKYPGNQSQLGAEKEGGGRGFLEKSLPVPVDHQKKQRHQKGDFFVSATALDFPHRGAAAILYRNLIVGQWVGGAEDGCEPLTRNKKGPTVFKKGKELFIYF